MEFFDDRNEFLQSLKSHMTPGHNTNSALDKDLHQISKEEMGTDNRELDTLVESYKIRVRNDIGKASLTLTEEQIGKVLSTYFHCLILIKCSRPSGD